MLEQHKQESECGITRVYLRAPANTIMYFDFPEGVEVWMENYYVRVADSLFSSADVIAVVRAGDLHGARPTQGE